MRLLVIMALVAACGPSAPPAASTPSAPAAAPAQPALPGVWRGCDGRLVEFTAEGDEIVGRYKELGGLGEYGFEVDEVGHRYAASGDGTYVGQVKWRFSDGREEWRDSTATVTVDTYEDTASDDCSRTLERVPPGA